MDIKFSHIRERFGTENEFTDTELMVIGDYFYLEDGATTVNLLDADQQWTCSVDPRNRKPDPGSIASRKASIESVGLLEGVRSGPCVRKVRGSAPGEERWWVFHWNTLLTGVKAAWEADHKKIKRTVQISVRRPIKDAKKYKTDTPDDVIDFYVDYFNKTNSENTETTLFQIMESTQTVEDGFNAHKLKFGLTVKKVGGAPAMDAIKFSFIESLFSRR